MRLECRLARFVALLFLVPLLSIADDHGGEAAPAEVMLVGVFHFANPGLDSVKSDVINVLTDENQAYLEALTDRLAAFEPTVVLLEYNPENEEAVNEQYRQYREGTFELGVNEVDQLGFRIAKKAGLERVYSFDERTVHWNAQPLFAELENLPERKAEMDGTIERLGVERSEMRQTLSLGEILAQHNDPAEDRRNKALYLMTNDIGAAEGFEGADASASWWHRNFRMYAHIQKHAVPGARVIAIGGQGHTAILKDLLADDPDRKAVEVLELF